MKDAVATKGIRVCHLTSVHPRYDSRIFLKQCRSLASAGFETSLVVADGNGDEIKNAVHIRDVGAPAGRWDRMWNITDRVYAQAISIDATIYHFHDPELVPVGLKLKRRGKCVIFDSHEDLPKQILGKPYLPQVFRSLISRVIAIYEHWACSRFDAVVAATPGICSKFARINRRAVNLNNYPLPDELGSQTQDDSKNDRRSVCYVGGVTANRGIRDLVLAMGLVSSELRLSVAGAFTDPLLREQLMKLEGWERVVEHGFVDRLGVKSVLGGSIAGLVTLHPTQAYLESLPIKMFEYMSASIPVIASNFPLWEDIIEGNDCGICVDPTDPKAIAHAIETIAADPNRARQMGANGRRAVEERFNWTLEESKLLSLYRELRMQYV